MGEAGGGVPGNLPDKTLQAGAGDPSLPLVCEAFPDLSSFSVLRETPMAFSCDNFKQLKCYKNFKIGSRRIFVDVLYLAV